MSVTLTIFVVGLAPCVISTYLTIVKLRSHSQQIRAAMAYTPPLSVTPVNSHDYYYAEGIGYVIGDILCQYNARSAYLRCAVNPAGPCNGCRCYKEIELTPIEDLDWPENQECERPKG